MKNFPKDKIFAQLEAQDNKKHFLRSNSSPLIKTINSLSHSEIKELSQDIDQCIHKFEAD